MGEGKERSWTVGIAALTYQVKFLPSAFRQFEALPKKTKVQIASRIDFLISDPRPHGCIKLSGKENTYRIRSGDYRILYQIRDKVLLVVIVGVGPLSTFHFRLATELK